MFAWVSHFIICQGVQSSFPAAHLDSVPEYTRECVGPVKGKFLTLAKEVGGWEWGQVGLQSSLLINFANSSEVGSPGSTMAFCLHQGSPGGTVVIYSGTCHSLRQSLVATQAGGQLTPPPKNH